MATIEAIATMIRAERPGVRDMLAIIDPVRAIDA
jgi:hypothetical protein